MAVGPDGARTAGMTEVGEPKLVLALRPARWPRPGCPVLRQHRLEKVSISAVPLGSRRSEARGTAAAEDFVSWEREHHYSSPRCTLGHHGWPLDADLGAFAENIG